MGTDSTAQLDAWLRSGGRVVAASDRAGRAIATRYHQARLTEGLSAWASPDITHWNAFVRDGWEQRASDSRLVLNSAQEEELWAEIIEASGHTEGWLPAARRRMASLAMEAHELLCSHAPQFLPAASRRSWINDPAAFGEWLAVFEERCRDLGIVSETSLPLELIDFLAAERTQRPPLLLAGFDRLLPVQHTLLSAWGEWQQVSQAANASDVQFYGAADNRSELTACAVWCRQVLDEQPNARILVITRDASARRGEIERAFLAALPQARQFQFEFSLGIPLAQVPIVRAARLLLEWLDGQLEENQLDWLFGSGYIGDAAECAMLQASMRAIRRRGLQRMRWALSTLVTAAYASSSSILAKWERRMTAAAERLKKERATQSPLAWADVIPRILDEAGFALASQLQSAEFQALDRWQQAIDLCGSLGWNGKGVTWRNFLTELDRTLDNTLYAPQSQDPAILIAGPAESAGLTADAIWFLGASEEAWPSRGSTHPLLPLAVQREASMPHTSPQADWMLAESITQRLLASAPLIRFSHARQSDGVDLRPSRLIEQIAGASVELPPSLLPSLGTPPSTEWFEDMTQIPLANTDQHSSQISGGSSVLTTQSQCAFKAFASARLGAQGWEPAESGLTASQRGQILHAVLHSVWGPGPDGIRTLDELRAQVDLESFVAGHVSRALAANLPIVAREEMPQRYIELEQKRLTRLVSEWLLFERERISFSIEKTEQDATVQIAGLSLKLRLDRVDKLNDGSLLVIDYKTGNVSPRSWELPRPDDVQLPLYARFAIDQNQLGGLVFAKIRPGKSGFAGKLKNPAATVGPVLSQLSSMARNPLTAGDMNEWGEAIERLAQDFLAGRADVDPREAKTCDRCNLHSLCRIREREDNNPDDEDDTASEDTDE